MIFNFIIIIFTILVGWFFTKFERISYSTIRPSKVLIKFTKRKQYIILICIVLILQSGLRNWAVGADTYGYYLSFERVASSSWTEIINSFKDYYTLDEGKDPGYKIFTKLFQYITTDFQVYLLIIAIIFFSSFGNFVYKNTNQTSDAILAFVFYSVLFYFFFSITGIRQTIATAASLYSFELIKKRKLLFFLILIFLASTIHKSVLVFLPFYFIYRLKIVKSFYLIIFLLLPVMFIFRNQISFFFKVLGGYENYLIYEGSVPKNLTYMIIFIALAAFAFYKQVIVLYPNSRGLYMAFSLALFFTPITWVNPSAMRVVQYFSIFMLLLIPKVINSLRLISINWKNTIYIITIFILLFLYLKGGSSLEYKFFWQEMKLGSNYR